MGDKVSGFGISIHALRGEGDRHPVQKGCHQVQFLSTPSVGRATVEKPELHGALGISIHALRGEGDVRLTPILRLCANFYPRPPWGGRRSIAANWALLISFLSTPSVGRATAAVCLRRAGVRNFYPRPPWGGRQGRIGAIDVMQMISIHALRGEGDGLSVQRHSIQENFYPRPPWGGRQMDFVNLVNPVLFLSTPSVGRATLYLY